MASAGTPSIRSTAALLEESDRIAVRSKFLILEQGRLLSDIIGCVADIDLLLSHRALLFAPDDD